jgi:hypothetical protein
VGALAVPANPWGGSGVVASAGPLQFVRYAPAGTVFSSTSSASFVAIDTVNLVITFVVPITGRALVTLQSPTRSLLSGETPQWGLLNAAGGAQVGDSALAQQVGANSLVGQQLSIYVTAAPGVTLVLQWAHRTSANSFGTVYGDGTAGNASPAYMWATALP